MRLRGVVHHQVGDDPDTPAVSGVDQGDEIVDGAEFGQHLVEVPDVIATVLQRRVVEGRQPNAVDPQPLQVIQALQQPAQATRPVRIVVQKCPDQHLVENRVFEPGRVGGQRRSVLVILGIGVLDHTVFDVTPLGGLVLDSGSCVVHQFHDARGTRGGNLGITPVILSHGNRIVRLLSMIRAGVRLEVLRPVSPARCARRPEHASAR